MDNQHYKSYEQAALDILRGKKPEEKVAEQQQEQPEEKQPLSESTSEDQVDEATVHPNALHVKPVKISGQTKFTLSARILVVELKLASIFLIQSSMISRKWVVGSNT